MFHDEVKKLAEKITSGLATDEEIALFNQYCNQLPPAADWDETILGNRQEVAAALRSRITTSIGQSQRNGRMRLLRRWVPAIAATLILVMGAWLFRAQILHFLDPVHLQQVATNQGERKEVILPDGTRIWLSPVSEIGYPDDFRGNTREITLKGEAFFEVAKDAEHPFIIHTDKINTKVLGTSFTIQAYQQDQQVLVTVVSGKVEVKLQTDGAANDQAVQLTPNQRAVFSKDVQSLLKEDYPDAAKQLQARREGSFEFKGVPVAAVMEELQRQFNTPIILQGNYQDCSYYGNLKVTDGLEKFLQKFSLTINATIKLDNNTWIVDVRGCR